MKSLVTLMLLTAVVYPVSTTPLTAGKIPWRAGESHQVGFGHCAKGPCMRRTCWAPTKPHRHVGGRIVVDKIGPKECWTGLHWN
jgi:hypothetical protein